ncbi:Peroxisome biogenesis factor 10 [Zea mays]|uniref:Peroxisome biogenesis factor 10 n=1 Tax=Zea mays TaxID=4577 RepID=A0A3L6EZF4_MAIZE|nr:Peroxisome biogenesis factor 10 [Zea mays]
MSGWEVSRGAAPPAASTCRRKSSCRALPRCPSPSATEGRSIHLLNEDGNIVSIIRSGKAADIASHSETSNGKSKCTLCLSIRQNPTATTCGHVFYW